MIDKSNLADRVYDYFKDKIINREFQPGERLNYNQLSKDMEISKTPLRDAFKQLEQDGFVDIKQRSGTFVSTPNSKNIIDIYNVRNALETLALDLSFDEIPSDKLMHLIEKVDLASKEIQNGNYDDYFKVDREVHDAWIVTSNNDHIIKIMKGLEGHINWFSVLTTKNKSRPFKSNEEHREILSAIENQDKEMAKKLLKNHIEEAKVLTLKDYGY